MGRGHEHGLALRLAEKALSLGLSRLLFVVLLSSSFIGRELKTEAK